MTATAVPPAPPRRNLGSRRRLVIASAIVLAALGFLLWRGLGESTVYFRTADEAVADRDRLGDRRFRIEGVVVDGSVRPADGAVRFRIASNRVEVPVTHRGDPPELFQPNIPVVLEGRWRGDTYESDRIMVRHSSSYKSENPDRVKEYVGRDGGDRTEP